MFKTSQTLKASALDAVANEFDLAAAANFDEQTFKAEEGQLKPIPKFSLEAYTGGKMIPNGFSSEVVVDLADIEFGRQVPVFLDHEVNGRGLVGHATPIVMEGRLVAQGVVSAETESARMVVESAKNGFPWQVSIGGGVKKKEFVKAGDMRTINGRDHMGPFYHLKARLQEMSFVPIGADSETSASIAAKKLGA
jgi:hypothetical protein